MDCALTFEELQALFDSRDIDITQLGEDVLDNASYFGRIFARCGGLADAVAEGIKEHNADFELKAVSCDGIDECRKALIKASKNIPVGNFIEGMACVGGCIGGADASPTAKRTRPRWTSTARRPGKDDKRRHKRIEIADIQSLLRICHRLDILSTM